MTNINIDLIKQIDPQNVYGSVIDLPGQCLHAWEEANKVDIPQDYTNIENVVMCGMGGSGLGARVIESLYFPNLKVPLTRINGYHIPAFVNEKTLVITSSYSGNTEETIQNFKEALDKKAKIISIGAGGELIELSKTNNTPYYLINPTHNPSNQPRMAIGYSVIGQLVLAAKAGILNINQSEVEEAVKTMSEVVESNDINKNENPQTLSIANTLKDKIVLYFSSEHLIGAVHVVNNQLNENAKNLSFDFPIPETNHHLMEGLKNPNTNGSNIHAVFFTSDLYSPQIKKRFEITQEVISKNKISNIQYNPKAESKFSQVFETIQYWAFVNYYLSILYEQDPAPIQWVDYFKKRMEELKNG